MFDIAGDNTRETINHYVTDKIRIGAHDLSQTAELWTERLCGPFERPTLNNPHPEKKHGRQLCGSLTDVQIVKLK